MISTKSGQPLRNSNLLIVKLKQFLEQRKLKKANFLPQPGKNNLVSEIVADIEDPNNTAQVDPKKIPASKEGVLQKDVSEVFKMKQEQANASMGQLKGKGIYNPSRTKNGLKSFMASRRTKSNG